MNWNAVCLKGMTGAALAVLPGVQDRALFAAAAEHYIEHYDNGFNPDGYDTEGLGYWNATALVEGLGRIRQAAVWRSRTRFPVPGPPHAPPRLSSHRLVSFNDGHVSFRSKDYAAGSKHKVMTIAADEFLRRFLIHVPPRDSFASTTSASSPTVNGPHRCYVVASCSTSLRHPTARSHSSDQVPWQF